MTYGLLMLLGAYLPDSPLIGPQIQGLSGRLTEAVWLGDPIGIASKESTPNALVVQETMNCCCERIQVARRAIGRLTDAFSFSVATIRRRDLICGCCRFPGRG